MSNKNQEKIKTLLHQVSFENPEYKHIDFRQTYVANRKFKQSSFNDISDWGDNNKLLESASLPKITSEREEITNRVRNLDFTSYRSSLLNSNQNDETHNFIKPVVLRFNPRIFTNSIRKSLISFQKARNVRQSVGQITVNKQPLLRKLQIDQLKSKYRQRSPFEDGKVVSMRSPRGRERYIGVLRILKKKEKSRCKKQNKQQNTELTAVRMF